MKIKYNKIKICMYFLIVLISLTSVVAKPVIQVGITVFNDKKTANLNSMSVFNGLPSIANDLDKPNAKIQLLDKDKKILVEDDLTISFYVYDLGFVSDMFITKNMPFNQDMKYLRFYFEDELLLEERLIYCNNNDICDMSENYLTCPSDCPLDQEDYICVNDKDGICDPDCRGDFDPDCVDDNKEDKVEIESQDNKTIDEEQIKEKNLNKTPIIIGLIAAIIIVGLILLKIIKENKNDY